MGIISIGTLFMGTIFTGTIFMAMDFIILGDLEITFTILIGILFTAPIITVT